MKERLAALLTAPVKIGLAVGIVIVVLLSAVAFFVPRMMDVRGLAPTIATEFSRALGQPVRVNGDVYLALVPRPHLIVKDIATADAPGAMLRLSSAEARADLSWSDLLLGRYAVSRLILTQPTVAAPWAALVSLGGQATGVVMDDAELTLTGLAAPVHIEAVDVAVSQGTWTLTGLLDGQLLEAEGRLFAPARTGARRLQATLRLPEADISVETSGTIAGATYDGAAKLTALRAGDVAALSSTLDIDPMRWAFARRGLAATTQIKASPERISLETGEITIAEDRATFWATIIPGAEPKFTLSVEVGAADVAPWLPGPAGDVAAAAQPRLMDRLFGGDLPWRGDIKVNAPALRMDAIILRDGLLDIGRAPDGWTVRNAAITLPGQSRVAFSGASSDSAGTLEGSWRVLSQDLRALLDWFGIDSSGVARDQLSSLNATGALQADARMIALSDLNVGFDGSQLTGRISVGWDQQAPFSLGLDVDRLALDAYWPLATNTLLRAASQSPGPAVGYGVTALAPWFERWSARRGVVRIGVTQLTWGDVAAGRFGLDLAFAEGTADIRSLAFEDTSGAALWLGGKITGLGAIPAADGLQLDLKVTDVARFGRTLRTPIPPALRALSPWTLSVGLDGPVFDSMLTFDARLGDLAAKARGTVGLNDGKPKLDAALEVAHPYAGDLRAVLWKGASFDGRLSGALAATATLKVDGSRTTVDGVTVAVGPNRLTARAEIDHATLPKSVKVEIGAIDMDWTSLAPVPLPPLPPPGDWQGEVVLSGPRLKAPLFDASNFFARITAVKNSVTLSEWRGRLFDGMTTLALGWNKEPDPQNPAQWAHRLQGQIALVEANPALMFDGLPANAKGELELTFNALAARPQGWLNAAAGAGAFRLTLPQGTALKGAGPLAPLSAVLQAENAGGKAAAALSANGAFSLAGGAMSFTELAVRANAYAAAFTGGIDLAAQTFDLKGTLRLKDRGTIVGPSAKLVLPPTLPMTIVGPLAAPTIKLDLSQR